MTETKQLPKRDELDPKVTWDLTPIFKDDAAFEAAFTAFQTKIPELAKLQGTLKNGGTALLNAVETILAAYRQLEVLYVYSHLKNDQDTKNTKYQGLNAKATNLLSQTSAATAWLEPEILTLSDETIEKYFAETPALALYRHFINNVTADRAHTLPAEQEALLAGASEIFDASAKTFSILNNADFKFPVVADEKGEKVQLSHGVYGQLLESTNRKVRKDAFKELYTVYDQFQNTLAQTLVSHAKMHNYKAKIRHFDSARQAALNSNHIPESVYDTLVAEVHQHLPLLHRYVALRKKLLGVDELHTYDLYTPLLGEAPIKFSYEEASEKALAALQVMGDDYLAHVKEAFNSRWIDVVENEGKRSGAYSSGCYDTNPYILMNWHDSLDQLYTLVHEMGHSIHSYYTRHNQPYVYGDYTIFLAEIASTTNENILTEYLLATEKDPKVRAFILNHYLDGFKGTVFRQTQFAEFEHFLHTEDAKGTPLTSDVLSKFYGDLNAEFYGPDLVRDPEIALEWSRIPHFYYNYYVYQYSTGFSAAAALSKKIWNQEEGALDHYLNYLKAGNSDFPIEVMKKAGVDMTKPDYLREAFKVFEARLNELESLVEQLKD
ncbi:oligoendopeptidase F [Enterococcus nangangensis]|uniref:oligoendopeptidase F n=1 Tax=Enterococcus nangangensis TaxID=2559926 RepID=UPI0010F9DE99|nr:oligoendopeptidase F [Enterococcus nangangensis]